MDFTSIITIGLTAFSTAIASYFAQKKLRENDLKVENKRREKGFLERITIDFRSLSNSLNGLRDEPDQLSYFSIRSIDLAKNKLLNIQVFLQNIVDLKKDSLRRDIFDIVESIEILIDELYILETGQSEEWKKHNELKRQKTDALVQLRIDLFNMEYIIDDKDNYQIKKIENEKVINFNDLTKEADKLKGLAIQNILNNFISEYGQSETKLNNTISTNTSRRSLLAIRLVGESTRLNDLIRKLEETQTNK